MRSGKPCPARERRASSAPACRIAARSWSLSSCRALSPGVLVPSARPAAGVRPSRADARAGLGTGPPPGRALTRTAPEPAHAPGPPLTPIARPAAAYRRWCRSSRGRAAWSCAPVRRRSPCRRGLAGRQPWAGAGRVPRARRSRATGRPATGRGRIRPGARSMTRREVSPGRGRSGAESAAAAAPALPARQARARFWPAGWPVPRCWPRFRGSRLGLQAVCCWAGAQENAGPGGLWWRVRGIAVGRGAAGLLDGAEKAGRLSG